MLMGNVLVHGCAFYCTKCLFSLHNNYYKMTSKFGDVRGSAILLFSVTRIHWECWIPKEPCYAHTHCVTFRFDILWVQPHTFAVWINNSTK